MSSEVSSQDEGFQGDLITRSASVPMVTEQKADPTVAKEIPAIEQYAFDCLFHFFHL